jgi:hypothetical protein
MSWLPGWDSIADTDWWSNFYFWAGIIALLLLGVSEVVSHRYTERKDELVAKEQAVIQQGYDKEIAQLHLEASQANERAVKLEQENLKLRDELLKRSARLLTAEQRQALIDVFKANPITSATVILLAELEPNSFGVQIGAAIRDAGVNVTTVRGQRLLQMQEGVKVIPGQGDLRKAMSAIAALRPRMRSLQLDIDYVNEVLWPVISHGAVPAMPPSDLIVYVGPPSPIYPAGAQQFPSVPNLRFIDTLPPPNSVNKPQ